MCELYQWGLELRAWKVHEVWVNLLRHDEKNRQIAQTWRTFPANYSDMVRKSGSMKGRARMRFKLCLESEPEKRAWKVQRFCILDTDSLMKSGKSTESLMLLGKIYRIFEEIRRGANQARSKNWAPASLSKLSMGMQIPFLTAGFLYKAIHWRGSFGEKFIYQNYNKAPLRSCWDASSYHSASFAYNRKVDICPFVSVNGNRSPISVVSHRPEVWRAVC